MFMLVLLGCLAVAQSAPADQAAAQVVSAVDQEIKMKPIDMKQLQPERKYLILNPEAQQQAQTIGKMQKPVFQPLTLFGSGPTKGKLQRLCDRMQNAGFGGLPDSFLGNLFVVDDFDDDDDEEEEEHHLNASETSAKQRIPEINTDAETIPEGIIPNGKAPQTPTNEYPVVREHRFYTIAGPPQFFGNVDLLQDPFHPIFSIQPLQAIKMKAMEMPSNEIPSPEMGESEFESSPEKTSTAVDQHNTKSQATSEEIENITGKASETAQSEKDQKKEIKNDTKIAEWDNVNTVSPKQPESSESKESKEISSENLSKSSINRLNVNFEQHFLTPIALVPKK